MNETITKKEIAKQYVKASVHYGHPPREWNPKMAPYILYAKPQYLAGDSIYIQNFIYDNAINNSTWINGQKVALNKIKQMITNYK